MSATDEKDEEKLLEELDFEAQRERQFDELNEMLENRSMRALQLRLEDINEFDVAEFLSEIDEKKRPMVFRMLSKETAAEVFANFDVEDQEDVINSITDSELAGIMDELYVDDAVDMMEELPANVVKRVMRAATPDTRRLINQYLHFPENSAASMAEMSGRTRKYYHITSSGLSLLKTEEARWAEYARGVDAVLGGAQNLA